MAATAEALTSHTAASTSKPRQRSRPWPTTLANLCTITLAMDRPWWTRLLQPWPPRRALVCRHHDLSCRGYDLGRRGCGPGRCQHVFSCQVSSVATTDLDAATLSSFSMNERRGQHRRNNLGSRDAASASSITATTFANAARTSTTSLAIDLERQPHHGHDIGCHERTTTLAV